jgi:class 3 adenylate cyclase
MNQTPPTVGHEEFVFAITSVPGATAACVIHGDLETVSLLTEYYGLVADALGRSEGRIVKVIGDGVLIVFPLHRAREAVDGLRNLQSSATVLWSAFDARCRLQVKVGAGLLASGAMGPPGAEQFDVYGKALNDLFKAPSGDFVIMPDLDALLG